MASFVDIRGDGAAFGANFDKLSIEIFRLGLAVDVDESFKLALIIDEITDEGGLGFGEVVLVFDQIRGGKAVFNQADVQGYDVF